MKTLMTFAVSLLLALPTVASNQDWYAKAVKSVELTIAPAEAKPGQTVTVRLTVVLNEKYHTYPCVQPDPRAAEQVNKITFAEADVSGLIFVGTTKDPENPTKKAEPLLGIKEMHLFSGTVTYERKAIVSPKATGTVNVSIPKFALMVCDDSTCFPIKTLSPEAKLTVAGDAVEIAKEYKDEVEKALAGKK